MRETCRRPSNTYYDDKKSATLPENEFQTRKMKNDKLTKHPKVNNICKLRTNSRPVQKLHQLRAWWIVSFTCRILPLLGSNSKALSIQATAC